MKTTRWLGAAVILAALGGAAWWGFVRVAEPTASYRTAKIERGELQSAVSATGTVTPVTQVQVSSQVSGQIKELFVDFNSEVRQGQLIARLDPETFEYRVRQSAADVEAARASVLTAQANVQSALAQVNRAQGDVAEAQRDEKRKQDLLVQNFISPAELDTAKARTASLVESAKVAMAQVDVSRAQVQNAAAIVKQREAQLQQARVDLERTQIRSPVAGIVIKRSVEVGQTVAASLQAPELFVIARNLSDMQVEAAIDEADISRVRDGLKVSFTIDAFPGRSFDGAVRQVRKAAVSSQNVVSYTVVVGFANPGSMMLPGMTANVRIITDTRDNVLKLPNAALRVRIAGVEPAASAPAARTSAAPGFGWLPSAFAQVAAPGGGVRARLVEGLDLDAAQQTKLDAVLAELRPGFVALRELPDEQRAAARDKLTAELRERVNVFLTPAQRERYKELQAQAASRMASAPSAAAAPPSPPPQAVPRTAAAKASAAGAQTAASVRPALPAGAEGGAADARAVAAPAVAAPGPLLEVRQRLFDELRLSQAQADQIDAIYAAQRPRFAELRNLPEGERAKARERILADMRAQVATRLNPAQADRYQALQTELAGRGSSRGRIYLLHADGKPRAYSVRLGISDGTMTELIVPPGSPDADVLVEGATVITAVVNGAAAARPAGGPRPF